MQLLEVDGIPMLVFLKPDGEIITCECDNVGMVLVQSCWMWLSLAMILLLLDHHCRSLTATSRCSRRPCHGHEPPRGLPLAACAS